MVRTYMSMVTYVRRCRCGIDGMVMVVGARPLVKGKQVGRGETPLHLPGIQVRVRYCLYCCT